MKAIKFFVKWVLYCSLSVIFTPSIVISTQMNELGNNIEHESEWLSIELSCNNTKVNIDDSIAFEVKLVNAGERNLTIFNQLEWGHWAGLRMMIADESGHPVLTEIYDDYLTIPASTFKQSSYINLFPSHYLGTIRLDTAKNLFRKPGKYSVVVAYLSPVLESSMKEYVGAKIKDLWGRERVSIISPTVWIEVVGD